MTAPAPTRARPRLTRQTQDGEVAGVCAGLGARFGLDPVLQGGFFGQLAQSRQQLSAAIAAGNYDGNPAQKAEAQALVAKAAALETEGDVLTHAA